MTGNTRLDLLAVIWTWHAVFSIGLAVIIGRAAYRHSGSPFRRFRLSIVGAGYSPLHWPITGRWLLTALFCVFAIMFLNVAYASWTVPISAIAPTWQRLLMRAIPAALEPWICYRIITCGLVIDPPRRTR